MAQPLYNAFVESVRKAYVPERVKDGVFGAMMQVGLVNDGPVTFEYDTAGTGLEQIRKNQDIEGKKKKWEAKKGVKKDSGQSTVEKNPPATQDLEAEADGS